jgi:hypothetical protein
MREYIVSLVKDVDYDQFWNEIENESLTDGFIPSRRVEIVNERPGSLRSCHYLLSDEEAEILRQDPRVYSVEIPPEQREDITIGFRATQTANFAKPSQSTSSWPSTGTFTNWGLVRNSNTTNVYGTGTATALNYQYLADGTGVDVVIQDSGLQIDHPEFTDATGNSRVQQINWYTVSGLSGTQSPNHYRDYDGHGTHVAGISTGKTYGWAKNAKVYSLKVSGLEGSGDSGTGISITDCFDVIKLWHRNKPIDPTIGRKRPTVVNMSWGYSGSYSNVTGGSYRGTSWTGSSADISKGMNSNFSCPVRVSSVDVDLQELIDEGVIVCIASGNSSHKVDIPTGIDYNNYWTSSVYGNTYYHRGSSPYSPNAIIVGALNSSPQSATVDKKAWFSNAGPGVDIFAAGDHIVSATSTNNAYTGGTYISAPYHLNSSFKQLNLSGTSQASPQIAGLISCYLQNNLTATPAQTKSWLKNKATNTLYSSGVDNDYSNSFSLFGGDTKVAFSSTAAGDTAVSGVGVWTGNGGHAQVNFLRLPPPIGNSFINFGFETGLVGWKILDKQIHFRNNFAGQNATRLANFLTPNDPTQTQYGSPGAVSLVPDSQFSHRFETSDMPPGGVGETQCLRLTLNAYSPVQPGSCVYGPAVYSDTSVELSVGDQIKFWFKGIEGTDKYTVYAYLVEQTTGSCIEILDRMQNTGTGGNWEEVTYTIVSGQDGVYSFVFINGTWDYTYGQAIGSDLLIDSIRIIKV